MSVFLLDIMDIPPRGQNFLDIYNNESDNSNKNSGGNGATTGGEENLSSTDPDEVDIDCWPTAPPIDYLETLKGYELTSFDATSVPPPPLPLPNIPTTLHDKSERNKSSKNADSALGDDDLSSSMDSQAQVSEPSPSSPPPPLQNTMVELDTVCTITDHQARSALMKHISDNHCCYGKGAAKHMVIKKLEYMPALHYELQTFSEKRETAWTYSSIRSGFGISSGVGCLHGYGSGAPPPLPWEIEEFPTQEFKDEVRLVAVPNTTSIKTCHRCRGTGGVTCRDCNGKGWSRCLNCHGDGYLLTDHHGSGSGGITTSGAGGGSAGSGTGLGRERCFYCQHSKHGHGHQDCSKCQVRTRDAP